MKIAICFSGMIRAGLSAVPNIKNFIGDLYKDTDFFMHTWDHSEPKPWHNESLKSRQYGKQNVIVTNTYEIIDSFVKEYDSKFISVKIDNFNAWRPAFSDYKDFSPHWYSWEESIRLKKEQEQKAGITYDYVLKIRPDLLFHPEASLTDEIQHSSQDSNRFYAMGYTDYRVDDVFFLARSDIMDKVSKFQSSINEFNWKTNIVGDYIRSLGISCDRLRNNTYAIFREEALGTDSLDFARCFNIDKDYYSPANSYRMPTK